MSYMFIIVYYCISLLLVNISDLYIPIHDYDDDDDDDDDDDEMKGMS